MTRFSSLLVFAASALVLSGCDGDEPPHGTLPPPVSLPECPDADYSTCDIRQTACQQRIGELAACMRGDAPLPNLRIDVLSEDAFANVLRGDTATPNPKAAHFASGLAVFGLGPIGPISQESDIQSQVANINGQYRQSDKRIIIVDHGKPSDSVDSDVTLLHELIHALQDADYDLNNWPSPDRQSSFFDGALARKSVIEGEASFYQYRAGVPFLGLDITEVDFESALQAHLDFVLDKAFTSQAPMNESFATFPYAYGALQAYAAWQSGGPHGADPIWANPPTTTQQVMSGVLGLDSPQPTGVVIPTPDVTGTQLTLESGDVQGAWGLNLLLARRSVVDAVPLALSWRGDHFWLATEANGPTIYVLWEIELASDRAATSLDQVFASSGSPSSFDLPQLEHATQGSRVYLSGAVSGAPSPQLTAAGKSWLSGN